MKTFIDALTWATAATSALAIIGTSASAARGLSRLKMLRARRSARKPQALDISEHRHTGACAHRKKRG